LTAIKIISKFSIIVYVRFQCHHVLL